MGIFSSITRAFSGVEADENEIWERIKTTEEIDELLDQSSETVVIFKHSPSCGTSLFAKNSLDALNTDQWEDVRYCLIDVIRSREASMHFAGKTELRHESPQLIVLHKGEIFWQNSHQGVNATKLTDTLNAI